MTLNKKICFISPFGYPLLIPEGKGSGGAERQFFIFGKELSNQGWRVSFITDHPAPKYEQQRTSLPVYPCSFSYLGGSNLRMPLDWLSLFNAMKKANSDYYVIKVPGHLLTPMAFFCRLFNKKLVFWGQMTFDADPSFRQVNSFAGWLQDWGIKWANVIIAQTQEQQNGFSSNYGIKSSVVPSICGQLSNITLEVSFLDNKTSYSIDVLWVGNSAPKKRYEVVIELAKLMPKTKFAIAMNISDENRFAQAKQDCQEVPNLDFLGMVSPTKMETIFSQTKIFLNTSTQEGFPNTYLQAWMNGIPVVSLNIDPDHVIATHNLGRVAGTQFAENTTDNFEHLALQLQPHVIDILNKKKLRDTIGENAVKYIAMHHSPEIVVPQLIKILGSLHSNDQ